MTPADLKLAWLQAEAEAERLGWLAGGAGGVIRDRWLEARGYARGLRWCYQAAKETGAP